VLADGGRAAGAVGSQSARLAHAEADPAAPERLVNEAVKRLGPLDALVLNHARSQVGALSELDASTLDLTWAVNVRAALLLLRAFAAQYRPNPHGGRVVLFISGQHRGPAPAEIPYAVTKGALHQITATLADALAEHDITVTCVNPGPTDIGWASPEQDSFVARHMPAAGGTPRPRLLKSSRCCSHLRLRLSPARSSTLRAGSGAAHPDPHRQPVASALERANHRLIPSRRTLSFRWKLRGGHYGAPGAAKKRVFSILAMMSITYRIGASRRLVDVCGDVKLDVRQPELARGSMPKLQRGFLEHGNKAIREQLLTLNWFLVPSPLRHDREDLSGILKFRHPHWTGPLPILLR
jgi:NAD(P)-dependent dehydrogenase (short-subunit alcohol dehydrogenase family)